MSIFLAPASIGDYDDYYKIRCSPSDIFWNGYTSPPDYTSFRLLFINRLGDSELSNPDDRRIYLIRNDQCSVGFVQFIKRIDGLEIGYSVSDEFQRHGYASNALLQSLSFAKIISRIIYVQIRDDNIASQAVALKCGFVRSEFFKICSYPKSGDIKLRKYYLHDSV